MDQNLYDELVFLSKNPGLRKPEIPDDCLIHKDDTLIGISFSNRKDQETVYCELRKENDKYIILNHGVIK
jgi:hypothetical protein